MSNPTLKDVRNRRAQIAKISADLKVEDDELAVAEKVLVRLGAGTGTPWPAPPPPPWAAAQPPPWAAAPPPPAPETEELSLSDTVKQLMTGNETLEQLIILLFENCIDVWWTANEVQALLGVLKGKEVPMGSVSPTLTAMKNSGVLVRDGLNVALASKVAALKSETAT